MSILYRHYEQPNFTVYRNPNRLVECEGLVKNLIHYGANPMYSCNPPPDKEHLITMKGFIMLYDNDDLILCKDYHGGDILCIQNYPKTINDFELSVNKTHSYWLYGLYNRLTCYRLGQKEYFKKQMMKTFTNINVKNIPLFPPTPPLPQKSEEFPMILD